MSDDGAGTEREPSRERCSTTRPRRWRCGAPGGAGRGGGAGAAAAAADRGRRGGVILGGAGRHGGGGAGAARGRGGDGEVHGRHRRAAAAGKGTIARRSRGSSGFAHLDTGASTARWRWSLAARTPLEAAQRLDPGAWGTRGCGRRRGAEASRVAAIPRCGRRSSSSRGLRAAWTGARCWTGATSGRSCAQAEAKLFVTATPRRGRRGATRNPGGGARRHLGGNTRGGAGAGCRDAGRDVAPLRAAPDAVVIDTRGWGSRRRSPGAGGRARADGLSRRRCAGPVPRAEV
jgi:cytidylate kinase